MRKLLLVAAIALLAGCQTPYQEMDGSALGGVKAEAIGYDRYRISALVNAGTPSDLMVDYLQLKSAETALKHGSRYFIVENVRDDTTAQRYVIPGAVNCWGGGCIVTPASTGQNVIPAAAATIRLVRGVRPAGAVDAQEIVDTIGKRVKRVK